jgi:hypothetical protein
MKLLNSGGLLAATTLIQQQRQVLMVRVTDAAFNQHLVKLRATIVLDPIPATIIATSVVKDVGCNGVTNQ